MPVKSYYLNTDLDLVSSEDLSELTRIIEAECDLLTSERYEDGLWHLSAEAKESGIVGTEQHNPSRDIGELIRVLGNLDERNKLTLRRCSTLRFNIGWQSSDQRPEGAFVVESELLKKMADLGVELAVTIYPSNENDSQEIGI